MITTDKAEPVAPRRRLDAELVRRKLARSREHAAVLVAEGRVRVAGMPATKPATAVDPAIAVVVTDPPSGVEYASRGGHKLAGALDVFAEHGLDVRGRRCLDAGASTGGFTDVLLRRGASSVLAVDVGYGQLAWSVRSDERVQVRDRTNVRDLTLDVVGEPVSVVVADLSFISLRLVLPALRAVATGDADFVLMVKPQFEVGKDRVGKGGVVRDRQLRVETVRDVALAGTEGGLGIADVTASPLPGPSGNVEYFLWLCADAAVLDPSAIEHAVARAVEDGPT